MAPLRLYLSEGSPKRLGGPRHRQQTSEGFRSKLSYNKQGCGPGLMGRDPSASAAGCGTGRLGASSSSICTRTLTLSSAPFPSAATVTLLQSFDWVFPPGTPSQDGPYRLFSAQGSRGVEHPRLEGRSPKHLSPPRGKRQMSLGPCGAAAEQMFRPIRTDRWWVVGGGSKEQASPGCESCRGRGSLITAAWSTLCRYI